MLQNSVYAASQAFGHNLDVSGVTDTPGKMFKGRMVFTGLIPLLRIHLHL